jgi:hypothetical protein
VNVLLRKKVKQLGKHVTVATPNRSGPFSGFSAGRLATIEEKKILEARLFVSRNLLYDTALCKQYTLDFLSRLQESSAATYQ